MLIVIFAVLSALSTVGICLATDAFAGMQWLWSLPLIFIGSFLLMVVLWLVMILIMTWCVNMEKEEEKDNAFYRWVVQRTAYAVVPLLGIKVHTQGFEQALPQGRFLLVSNHLHDIDPAFLLRAFPESQLAFIAKREVRDMFVIGPMLKKLQGQFIHRENDREALKTILKCIQILKEDRGSVAVFPEGYIKPDRKLHPFRPGVFKIAQKAKVPIVVCTLRNTNNVLTQVLKLQKAEVHLHLLAVIPAEELEGVTAVDVAHRVHKMMADDLGPDLVHQEENA